MAMNESQKLASRLKGGVPARSSLVDFEELVSTFVRMSDIEGAVKNGRSKIREEKKRNVEEAGMRRVHKQVIAFRCSVAADLTIMGNTAKLPSSSPWPVGRYDAGNI